jgi:predicted PurR-regulated permease PerM
MTYKSTSAPNPYLALLFYALAVVIGLWALRYAGLFFVPLFTGFVFAYLLNPLLEWFMKLTRIKRKVAGAILVLVIFLSLIAILIPLVPYLLERMTAAAEKLPQTLSQFSSRVDVVNQYLVKNFPDFVGKIDLMSQIERMIQISLGRVSDHFFELFSSLYGVVFTVAYIILIPLFTFFILKDYYRIRTFLFSLVPLRWTAYFKQKTKAVNMVLAAYIRGQAVVVIILSVCYALGLSLIGLPFPVVIGIFSGLGDIIPYFGTVMGLIVSLVVGFVHFQTLQQTMLIMVVFGVIKLTENWFFYPKIVGGKVGLPFVFVLLSIIGFGKVFGFWGLLVAIPISAGFKLFLLDAYEYYRRSPSYLDKETER